VVIVQHLIKPAVPFNAHQYEVRKDSAQLGEEHGSLEKEVTDTRKTSLEGNRATGTG
jgi:hypothetical protein